MTRPDKLHKQWKEDKVVKLDNCSINGALHNQDGQIAQITEGINHHCSIT